RAVGEDAADRQNGRTGGGSFASPLLVLRHGFVHHRSGLPSGWRFHEFARLIAREQWIYTSKIRSCSSPAELKLLVTQSYEPPLRRLRFLSLWTVTPKPAKLFMLS